MANPPESLERLREYWAAQRLGTGAPLTEQAIAEREQRYGVKFPDDLRAYFRAVNGMSRDVRFYKEWDEDLIRFFPLEELRPVNEEWPDTRVPAADELFFFADYSIWGWGYAVRLRGESTGEVLVVYDPETVRVAGSFSDFLASYIARDYAVTYPR